MNSIDIPSNNIEGTSIPPLSREKMEMLLPDYAFGCLADDECFLFEQSLPLYPELQTELEEIQTTFSRIDVSSLNRSYAQRLKNLSVHVQERLVAEKRTVAQRWKFFRVAIPALIASMLTFIVVLPPGSFERWVLGVSRASALDSLIRPDEVSFIWDDESLREGISEADIAFADQTVIEPLLEVSEKESLLIARMIDKETLLAYSSGDDEILDNEMALLDELDDDDIDETLVQALISEMS